MDRQPGTDYSQFKKDALDELWNKKIAKFNDTLMSINLSQVPSFHERKKFDECEAHTLKDPASGILIYHLLDQLLKSAAISKDLHNKQILMPGVGTIEHEGHAISQFFNNAPIHAFDIDNKKLKRNRKYFKESPLFSFATADWSKAEIWNEQKDKTGLVLFLHPAVSNVVSTGERTLNQDIKGMLAHLMTLKGMQVLMVFTSKYEGILVDLFLTEYFDQYSKKSELNNSYPFPCLSTLCAYKYKLGLAALQKGYCCEGSTKIPPELHEAYEKRYSYALSFTVTDAITKPCSFCNIALRPGLKCPDCAVNARYCGRDCQKKDWPKHKTVHKIVVNKPGGTAK